MATLWYVRRAEQVKGPFKADVVARFIARSQIRDTDMLSRDREVWQPLAVVRPLLAEELDKVSAAKSDSTATVPADAKVAEAAGSDSELPATAPAVPQQARTDEPNPTVAHREPAAPSSRKPAQGSAPAGHPVSGARRPRPNATNEPLPAGRLKQASALVSVMGLIVVAGLTFLPAPEGGAPQCDAPPAPGVNWNNCRFQGRDLGRVELDQASLRSARMSEAQLLGASLGGADLAYVELDRATLAYADLSATSLVGANLRDADLSYARLNGADLSHADLTGANLGGADLAGAKFDHAIWIDRRTCYEGSTGGCRVPLTTTDSAGVGSAPPPG